MSALRDQVWANGQDIQVEVNQRALIDKVLARYSGEFVLFRELLQNADDARSSHVELRFSADQTTPRREGLPDFTKQTIANITVRNNGIVFREDDWSRLRKIAEGNPDESQIGQFGVGFYSLFSICEEPIVMSGDSSMLFFWKGDQLYVRRAPNPKKDDQAADGKPWTTFHCDAREASPMPPLAAFCRFLANALAFTSSLRTLSLYYEDTLLCEMSKKLAPVRPLTVAREIRTTTPQRLMTVQSAEFAPVQIDVKAMECCTLETKTTTSSSFATGGGLQKMLQAFTSASAKPAAPKATSTSIENDLSTVHSASLFLRVINANVAVSLNAAFSRELHRATKKPAPRLTVTQLIYATKDEFDAGRSESGNEARALFDGLVSHNLESQGRLAIGFLTHQTSGNAASVAGRFIPTVERESLDFQAPTVAEWNRELLATLGILSRVVYEDEMTDVAAQWSRLSSSSANDAEKQRLFERSAHVARYFTFYTSTPSPIVGNDTERAFFDAAKNTIAIMSTQGPLPVAKVRFPNHALAAFLKDVPTLPEVMMTQARGFVEKLQSRGLLRDITFDDVFGELRNRALTVEEMQACLKWWIQLADEGSYDSRTRDRLLDVAMLMHDSRILPLSGMRAFINTSTLPTDLPLPSDTLPYDLTKTFRTQDLRRVFGWHDLEVIDFMRNLLSPALAGSGAAVETNMLQSPHFAEKILTLLSRIWQNLPVRQQTEIIDLLKDRPCVPTRHGLKRPAEAYHPAVNLFEDLDVVTFPSSAIIRGAIEKLLLQLGMRKHVDLQLVFSRMLGGGTWSHRELLTYLVSVESELKAEEIDRLKKTAWLPKEGGSKPSESTSIAGSPSANKIIRYRASDLYEPIPPLRPLGVPLLDWGTGWRSFSPEGKLLTRLGLKKHPPVEDLLHIAADPTKPAKAALGYFVNNHIAAGYHTSFSREKHDFAFVPCLGQQGMVLAKPSEAFTNPSAAILDFKIVHPDWRHEASKFKLSSDPSAGQLIFKVMSAAPQTAKEAEPIFAYLSTRISSFSASEINAFRDAAILPVRKDDSYTLVKPSAAYFGAQSAIDPLFKELFTFVDDYGPASRPFLTACGVREAPTANEVAQMLVNDPRRFYSLAGNAERYLRALRQVAVNGNLLPTALRKRMRDSPFFLGLKRATATQEEDDEDDEGGAVTQYLLVTPASLVIVDDASEEARFRSHIIVCPQEDVLEAFALELGAIQLSKIVQREYRVHDRALAPSEKSKAIAGTIIERATLFLHDHQQKNNKVARDDVWLKDNLQAADVGKLELVSTLTHNNKRQQARQPVSAGAVLEQNNKKLTMLVARNLEVDWFEVSEALCSFMLSQKRRNDVLVLMTLLSTPLKTLKRRGYNVDRILNARRAEKEAQLEQERQHELQAQLDAAKRPTSRQMLDGENQLAEMLPQVERASIRKELEAQAKNEGNMEQKIARAADELIRREASATSLPGAAPPGLGGGPLSPFPSSSIGGSGGLLTKLRRGFGNSSPKLPLTPSTAPVLQGVNAYQQPLGQQAITPHAPQTRSMLPDPQAQVSPVNDIKANVLRALSASRPDQTESIGSQPEMRQVKESESTYCDASGARDLEYVADVGGLRFFCAKTIDDHAAVLEQHSAALGRFCSSIVKPIAQSFALNPRVMHIFYDLEGPLIAFNRTGSIFLNLRYYIGWHDEDVKAAQVQDALISWWFSVSHELAHNLVIPHTAEHEYWFSSISEHALPAFAEILASHKPRPTDARLVEI